MIHHRHTPIYPGAMTPAQLVKRAAAAAAAAAMTAAAIAAMLTLSIIFI